MNLLQNYYSPIDVAIHWCHLTHFQNEIRKAAVEQPHKLFGGTPQWPLLDRYLERICDAIDYHDLPAWYLGRPLMVPARTQLQSAQVRPSDVRFWTLRCFPEDKPDFLFRPSNDDCHCVSLGAHLALTAERDGAVREIEKLRQECLRLQKEVESEHGKFTAVLEEMDVNAAPPEQSLQTLLVILGAVLKVGVGKAPNGQWQSIYKTQSAMVSAILRRFPGIACLSKRTLDRKFAQARQILTHKK